MLIKRGFAETVTYNLLAANCKSNDFNIATGLESNLWMQHDLEEMVSNATKEATDIPEHIKNEVLHSIEVLLVTVNISETLAVQNYLQKLHGHTHIYKFLKPIGLKAKCVTFYIGKYGICPAAIGVVPDDFEVHGNSSSLTMIAYECFPNLSTIISVGIVCGIQMKVKMCDVLVSSKIVYHGKEKADYGKPKRKTIDVSRQLVKIFNQLNGWPDKSIQERLEYNQIQSPNVVSGVILSGLHNIDNLEIKSEDFGSDVIGSEMEGVNLFKGVLQNMVNIIIVRAVCKFEGGKDNESIYQPIAALLAADLVYECLCCSEARKLFTGMLHS